MTMRAPQAGRTTRRGALAAGALAASSALVLAPTASAAAGDAQVRFLHAVPGAGAATLADGSASLKASFGELSDYTSVASGAAKLTLTSPGASSALARRTERLEPGAKYTIVAEPVAGDVRLRLYPDATAGRPGSSSLLRIIHAAPELGSPDVLLGGKRIAAKVPYGASSGYAQVPAGSTSIALAKPGTTKDPLLKATIDIKRGSPLSVFVVGSRGESVRPVTSRDTRSTGGSEGSSASGSTYIFKRGDTMWSLARRRVGAGASDGRVLRELHRIWFRNDQDVPGGDPDVIPVGQRLQL